MAGLIGEDGYFILPQDIFWQPYIHFQFFVLEFMDTMLEEPIICEILASYVAEAFYFPPHIFETSFHGNGWICLVPQLQDGQNLVAVRVPK